MIFSFLILTFSFTSKAESRFEIRCSDPELTLKVESILKSSYQDISFSLQESFEEKIEVIVADNEKEFLSKSGGTFPDWGIGFAYPQKNLIVVKSPNKFTYNKSLSEILSHELAHLFLNKKAKYKNLPRWVDEGFAMQKSKEWRIGQDIAVAKAILTGSLVSLSQIERLNTFKRSKAELAYTESFLAVSYFLSEYGEENFNRLVDHIGEDKNLDSAFMSTTGSDFSGFQKEFEDYLKKRYQFIALLGDTFLLWLGLAFLIVLIYVMKKRKTKKILKRWEKEDEDLLTDER